MKHFLIFASRLKNYNRGKTEDETRHLLLNIDATVQGRNLRHLENNKFVYWIFYYFFYFFIFFYFFFLLFILLFIFLFYKKTLKKN